MNITARSARLRSLLRVAAGGKVANWSHLMRKKILAPALDLVPAAHQDWLDLSGLGQVEITSEDPEYPIEGALAPGSGWRAAQPGKQVVRMVFDTPQSLRRIYLMFQEDERERTQEFTVRWSADGGLSYRDVVRQQYHFSPPGTVREIEDYRVNLDGVTAVELSIVPDIREGDARASIAQLRLR